MKKIANWFCNAIIVFTFLYMAWQVGRSYEKYNQVPIVKMEIVESIRYVDRTVEVEKPVYVPTETKYTEIEFTAYCAEPYAHAPCNDGDWAHTATGTTPVPGINLAVDPKVIPYGSRVYIDGVGLRIAEDTGGGIIGNEGDILVVTHEEALQFGRQTLRVWVLE